MSAATQNRETTTQTIKEIKATNTTVDRRKGKRKKRRRASAQINKKEEKGNMSVENTKMRRNSS